MRFYKGHLWQFASLLGLLFCLTCTNDNNTSVEFRPLQGTLIVQSSPPVPIQPISPKQRRHLGSHVTSTATPQILWVTGKDTIVLNPASGFTTGIRLVELDSTAAGLENFIKNNSAAPTPAPFTVVVSPLGWKRSVQLHPSVENSTGQLWICTQSKFKREPLQLGNDVLVSPGNDRKYIFKIALQIQTNEAPLIDVSTIWFKQEQLAYTLTRESRGKYPAQSAINWAPSPTLLSYYQTLENQIDSLRTVIADIPNTIVLNIIPF